MMYAQGAKNQPKYKGVLNFMNTAICPRMLMQTKVSMHVEVCCLLTKTSAAQSEFTAAAVPASAKHESGTTSDFLERVSNRKADSRIRIDVDLEDYYRIKANKSEKA